MDVFILVLFQIHVLLASLAVASTVASLIDLKIKLYYQIGKLYSYRVISKRSISYHLFD